MTANSLLVRANEPTMNASGASNAVSDRKSGERAWEQRADIYECPKNGVTR